MDLTPPILAGTHPGNIPPVATGPVLTGLEGPPMWSDVYSSEPADPALADPIALAETMGDMLALPRAKILSMTPRSLAAYSGAHLPDHLKPRTQTWAANLHAQARRAEDISQSLDRGDANAKARTVTHVLDQVARHEWHHKIPLRRWMQKLLPESLWLPYGFKLDEPEKCEVQVGSPKHPHHIVITLGRKDFLRFAAGINLPWNSLTKKQRQDLKKDAWMGGQNLRFAHGQFSILCAEALGDKPNAAALRARFIAHEESHAIDHLFESYAPINISTKWAPEVRALRARRAQNTSLKTEIIAFLTETAGVSATQIMHGLIHPERYSRPIWYAIAQWGKSAGEDKTTQDFARKHYHLIAQSLQAAELILEHPRGAHLLRLTDLEDWPRLAGKLFPSVSSSRIAEPENFIEQVHRIIEKLNRLNEKLLTDGNNQAHPALPPFTRMDLIILHDIQARALAQERLYLDEEAALQAWQNFRAAWVATGSKIVQTAYGMDITAMAGAGNPDRTLARRMRRAYDAFFAS